MAAMQWVDLTAPLWEGSDRAGKTRAPSFEQFLTIERDHFSMMEYRFVSHIGTHLDAPNHFIDGGASIDEVPLDQVIGPGVVLDVAAPPLTGLSGEVLAAGGPEPEAGDIVLLRTGWEDKAGTPDYFRHPYLTDDACRWLIEHRVKLVGMDLITPEMPEAVREGPFTWPAHRMLMGAGVLVMENVCHLVGLVRRRVEVMAAPIPIRGGDGAPVRLLARELGAGGDRR